MSLKGLFPQAISKMRHPTDQISVLLENGFFSRTISGEQYHGEFIKSLFLRIWKLSFSCNKENYTIVEPP